MNEQSLMPSATYNAWTRIDDGLERLWQPDVWLGTLEIIAKHEGEDVHNASSPIYAELKAAFPGTSWLSKESNGSDRSLFRDYGKPWKITGLLSVDGGKFTLTSDGRRLASGALPPKDFFSSFAQTYTEDKEQPFRILAAAFLGAGEALSLEDIYHGVMLGFRPGDDIKTSLASARASSGLSMEDTKKRRLRLLLSILERCGAVVRGDSKWVSWDIKLLQQLASPVTGTSVTASTAAGDIQDLIKKFTADSADVGLQLRDLSLPTRLAAALLAKRFVILTGLSGSGKSKIAQAFARWMSEGASQYCLVAVGADWTTNENIIGYQDALQPNTYRKPTNGILDLIIRAHEDSDRPYFLILDEMNLSHVERYFADMLSAIESEERLALHSNSAALEASDGSATKIPNAIPYPRNLFVIGTVNVDETTYMFSPKVLDRSNVIEFRVSTDDIRSFLDTPTAVNLELLSARGATFGSNFVQACKSEVDPTKIPAAIADGNFVAAELRDRLLEIFSKLAPIGAEFGFRTAHEISRYFYFHALLVGSGWKFDDALDAQIYQKLLPKLHGSERRLRPILEQLGTYCDGYKCVRSKQKIDRMINRLSADGFASFAEA